MHIFYQSPVKGHHQPITYAPDETFSEGLLGNGFVIDPSDEMIYAPVSGTIKLIMPTKHAIAISTEEGVDVLMHIGFGTVELKGEGIELYIEPNQGVKQGDLIAKIDLSYIKSKQKHPDVAVVFVQKPDLKICKEWMIHDILHLELEIA